MSEFNVNSKFTLLERAKRSTDGMTILPILDVMDQRGVPDLLMDVPFFPGNQGLRHRVIRTVSRPASTRRNFYQGVGSTITTTQVIMEDIVLFEQRSEIDEAHLDTVVNPKEVRRQEDEGHIAGLMEDVANAIFNDTKVDGSEFFDGFARRVSGLSYPGHGTETYPYTWDNGGTGSDLSSIYVVEYGPNACFGLYPGATTRLGPFGITVRDHGKERITQTNPADVTKIYYAWVSQFLMYAGLGCADDRKFARVANIETSGTSSTFNEDILIRLLNHGRFNIGATRMYMNPFVKSDIDIRAKDKANVNWSSTEVFGKPVTTFLGIPVRVLDETILAADEDAIT